MRYIRYICIAVFAIALVSACLANRDFVTIKVLPDELAGLFAVNPQMSLPLFVVIIGGILVGLFVGFVWEWLREHGIRSDASKKAKEIRRLEREIRRLKSEKVENQGDDVLALLDETS